MEKGGPMESVQLVLKYVEIIEGFQCALCCTWLHDDPGALPPRWRVHPIDDKADVCDDCIRRYVPELLEAKRVANDCMEMERVLGPVEWKPVTTGGAAC
jgi:hypothetical protein